jgi:ClpP class serine protease
MMRQYHPRGLQAIEPQALFELFPFEAPTANVARGIATTVTVRGPLVQHGGCWADSYESIRQRVESACSEAPPVVLLRIDSPGGEVAGCFDTARAIRAAVDSAGKRLVVHVEGQCCSAAYALACMADRIVASRTASVGSIGVIAARLDATASDAQMGHRFALITSGARKADGNPHSPLESDELLVHQGEVDELAGEFFELVASSRGIQKDDVEALQAASLRGQAALAAGLIDELGSFDDLIASLNTENVETEEMDEEEKVLALLRAMTEDAQLDEQSRSRARRALAAMAEAEEATAEDEDEEDEDEEEASAESDDEDDDEDDDEEAEEDDDEEKAVSTATAGELAQRSATLERRLLKLERQHEAQERKRLIKAHGGVPAGLAAILNQKPLAEVKALLRELPKPRQPKLGDAAATTTIQATRGQHQGDAPQLPPQQARSMRLAMGLEQDQLGIVEEGDTLFLGAPEREAY